MFFYSWICYHHDHPDVCSFLAAGPGLDQSGFDGEEIIRIHLICTTGRQNHQVLNTGAVPLTSYMHTFPEEQDHNATVHCQC